MIIPGARTRSILNQKGGVGKSTLAWNLAGIWSKLGHRVALVDMDPQGSCSQTALGYEPFQQLSPDRTTSAIAAGDSPDPADLVIRGAGIGDPDPEPKQGGKRKPSPLGCDLYPACGALAEFNTASPERIGLHAQLRLRSFLRLAVQSFGYDRIVIDCPPNLQACGWLALMASDGIVIPVNLEDFGIQGLPPVLEMVARVREAGNSELMVEGIVANRVKKVSLHDLFNGIVRDKHPGLNLETQIREAIPLGETLLYRQFIHLYKPRSQAAKLMEKLALELEDRAAGAAESGGVAHA